MAALMLMAGVTLQLGAERAGGCRHLGARGARLDRVLLRFKLSLVWLILAGAVAGWLAKGL